jgi:hypothetical protein
VAGVDPRAAEAWSRHDTRAGGAVITRAWELDKPLAAN